MDIRQRLHWNNIRRARHWAVNRCRDWARKLCSRQGLTADSAFCADVFAGFSRCLELFRLLNVHLVAGAQISEPDDILRAIHEHEMRRLRCQRAMRLVGGTRRCCLLAVSAKHSVAICCRS